MLDALSGYADHCLCKYFLYQSIVLVSSLDGRVTTFTGPKFMAVDQSVIVFYIRYTFACGLRRKCINKPLQVAFTRERMNKYAVILSPDETNHKFKVVVPSDINSKAKHLAFPRSFARRQETNASQILNSFFMKKLDGMCCTLLPVMEI